MEQTKIILDENEMPKKWYNIQADLPKPLDPPLHPKTKEPLKPEDLAPLFPMELIRQEMSQERYIEIPQELREIYRIWRPTPLLRAHRLEKFLKTPARIYYKYEGVSPPGSHKPNTAIAQAYYNMKENVERITTETGAGQWGSALAFATSLFKLKCKVYMVKCSFDQKPYRKIMMKMWSAECVASPSNDTEIGKKILSQDSGCSGSLGIAISEAIEDAVKHKNTKYSLGSVLNHVLMHQTIVGLELKEQMKILEEEKPDIMIGCVGGGSNYAGFCFPYMQEKLRGKSNKIKFIAVEPASCPTLTKGLFAYDFGDTAKITPLVMMYSLGHGFIPPEIHAGGLRYHGMAPLISRLVKDKVMEARAVQQLDCFKAAVDFTRVEGIIPAPETAHAIKITIDEALKAKKENKEKVIVFNFSGHGFLDMKAYADYFGEKLRNHEYPKKKIKEALKDLPKF
jgi:tryptophan synthase beta chain